MSTAASTDHVDHTRLKLFCAVRDGAILYVDKQAKEAHLDWSEDPDELVPYQAAASWADHLDQMAAQAKAKGEDKGAAPSTPLSNVVVKSPGGTTRMLSEKYPLLQT